MKIPFLHPRPKAPDRADTGENRWVVIKRKDNVVREELQRGWIDMDTGERGWVPVTVFGEYRIGANSPQPTWPERRVRTLTPEELAAE